MWVQEIVLNNQRRGGVANETWVASVCACEPNVRCRPFIHPVTPSVSHGPRAPTRNKAGHRLFARPNLTKAIDPAPLCSGDHVALRDQKQYRIITIKYTKVEQQYQTHTAVTANSAPITLYCTATMWTVGPSVPQSRFHL